MDTKKNIVFDVEMVGYDDLSDATTVRISRAVDNGHIADAVLTWSEDEEPKLQVAIQNETAIIFTPATFEDAIADAVKAELDTFQKADPNHFETLQELFEVVIPSGEVRAGAIGH
jgi:hypothetical protein